MKLGVDQPDIAALEHACLTAVPAQRVAFDGSFVVRAFLGGTGRANAASSLRPELDPELAARIARIERRYEALGLPVRFRSTPLDPRGMAELLRAPARRAEKERAADMMMVPAAWLVLYEDAKPMACISVVADGALAGFFDLAVVPEARRQGLGSRITRAAAQWAAEQGANWLWAQVASANQASCAAQQSLGMREAYRYVYVVRPQDKVALLHFG